MNDSTSKPAWLTPEVQEHLRRVEYDYQAREFGEEMARVNFLPMAERRKQIAEMMDHAVRKGVVFEKRALGVTP
jgi:hypothetical protein